MSRILFVATSDIHINTFHIPYLEWLAGQGHTIDLAIENRANIDLSRFGKCHYLKFPRVALSLQHVSSYRKLKGIIDHGNYQLVHCHTPIPSALCRLSAARWRRNGGKVIYTAHGFHFYRGGPIRQWATYYPTERILSSYTDAIITINHEDYEHAKGFKSSARVFLIPGIGVSPKFSENITEEPTTIKRSFGLDLDDFIVTYIAEFIHRKNHLFIVNATAELTKRIPNLKILFVGKGKLFDEVRSATRKSGLENTINFLGYRDDVHRIARITDLAVSSSLHEGLGLGLAEQMMCGIPAVASQDKGHAELIDQGVNGFLFCQNDRNDFIEKVASLYMSPQLRKKMGEHAKTKAQKFKIDNALAKMIEIYREFL